MPTKILILTTFHLDVYVTEALRAGASGFLPERETYSAKRPRHLSAFKLLPEASG